jgi:hypothetical protein
MHCMKDDAVSVCKQVQGAAPNALNLDILDLVMHYVVPEHTIVAALSCPQFLEACRLHGLRTCFATP